MPTYIRVKDLPNSASQLGSDDYLYLSGTTFGARKILKADFLDSVADSFNADPNTYKLATLDSGGKVDSSQWPASAFSYQGTWAASSNTPTLANGSGTAGYTYYASDSGSVNFGAGSISFTAGDAVVYDGSIWQKVPDVANILDGKGTVDEGKTTLQIPNVGTAANEVSVNGMLGDLAFQSSEGLSVGALKADYGTTTTGTGTAVSGIFNAYERGTFTPTIYYQNATGLTTSYTTQSGNYVRTGDLVAIQIKLVWTVTGTPVNDNLGVRGIPFQPASEDSLTCHDSQGQTALVTSNSVNDILICLNSSLTSNQADNVGTGTHTIRISGTYQIS